ncbi:sodium/potassium/calcium exchanger 1-like [Macrobrachium nipponense]|uniref:sodium/potassium/calcium exchanger 1-like n=1 Tax=Macrobrachium nipponense TaxID=159736 RepID=UPI0030C7B4A7
MKRGKRKIEKKEENPKISHLEPGGARRRLERGKGGGEGEGEGDGDGEGGEGEGEGGEGPIRMFRKLIMYTPSYEPLSLQPCKEQTDSTIFQLRMKGGGGGGGGGEEEEEEEREEEEEKGEETEMHTRDRKTKGNHTQKTTFPS